MPEQVAIASVPVPVLAEPVASAGLYPSNFVFYSGDYSYDGTSHDFAQVKALCGSLNVLYIFSGPRRADDFASAWEMLGASAQLVDTVHDNPRMHLLDEAIFDTYLNDLRSKKVHAVMASMPCSTFAGSQSQSDCRHRHLRGTSPTCIFGLSNLPLKDKEITRIGTILALRGATVTALCNDLSVPWLAETPQLEVGQPSILLLPQWQEICSQVGTHSKTVMQCELGATSAKTTDL